MSDLSKSKKIGENVSDSRQLTALIKELNNAIRGLKPVDEYLTRFSRAKGILGKESVELGEIVDQKKINLHNSLLDIGKFVQSALDSIPIDEDELDVAVEQLVKFTHDKEHAIEYVEKELRGQTKDAYWFKYWTGLLERLNKTI